MFFKKLVGNTEIEDGVQRLDKLTQEEARMASAELLKVTHGVGDRVKDVEGKVEGVHGDVQGVGNKVQNVDERVQDIQVDVQDVGNKVHGVDNRVQHIGNDVKDISSEVREVNRSLSLKFQHIIQWAQTATQGINSEIVFYGGFLRQIHPSIITLPAKLITMVLLNGFFKAVYSINGNPPVPSCGYMESVCYS